MMSQLDRLRVGICQKSLDGNCVLVLDEASASKFLERRSATVIVLLDVWIAEDEQVVDVQDYLCFELMEWAESLGFDATVCWESKHIRLDCIDD
jgi:hypothetical protein